ncbi:LruC domain-containing protein [Pedobacter sp. JCM 36344]|uniref:LruC domain-containing protein n=1 Tax=Pedobacter sp. JCM 36344 TaxID=3374280 RepID=UPI00397CB049
MIKNLLSIFLTITLFLSACKKELTTNTENALLVKKYAPDGFAYKTTRQIELNVRLLSRTEEPVSGVLVSIFDPTAVGKGKELIKVLSDKNGYVRTKLNIASSVKNLVIDPSHIGLASNVTAFIKDNALTAVIGGKTGYSGNIVLSKSKAVSNRTSSIGGYTFNRISGLGPSGFTSYNSADFDALGRPISLLPVDNISFATLMNQIDASLPNGIPVKNKYIATEVPTDLKIERLADVWITFVHEGADYRNTLAYYTYPTGNPPTNENQITNANVIFPNCSLIGGNGEGNMITGDKVKLGRFPAGTSVGFVLLQNAYQGNGSINFDATKFFSTEGINPENDPAKKRHNVVLHNVSQRTFLIGFEDINRLPGQGSDNDFNDLVFYAQSNPVEAISPVNVPVLDESYLDGDGDGVQDAIDDYPNDPTRAYTRWYPSQSVWGTTAFEDNWPFEGDYDLNDLVVSYRYKFAMNSSNQLVDLTGEFKALAAGADFENGFGVQLPFTPSQIQSVTGMSVFGNAGVVLDGKGLERNQSKAVIIPFDHYRNLFGVGTTQINTTLGAPKLVSPLVTVTILLNGPLSDEYTGMVPFNPFMISNLDRGREVHLVNQAPTDLAAAKWFNTGADNSNAATGRYYVSSLNRPFALDFFGPFDYPIEKTPITNVYNHFADWALSGGTVYPDWYFDYTGYINSSLIYR